MSSYVTFQHKKLNESQTTGGYTAEYYDKRSDYCGQLK